MLTKARRRGHSRRVGGSGIGSIARRGAVTRHYNVSVNKGWCMGAVPRLFEADETAGTCRLPRRKKSESACETLEK